MASTSGNTPRVPRITLTTFAEYLTARPAARIDCVRDQIKIYEQDYHPGPAFYGDLVEAIVKGRSTGADHRALEHAVQAQRNDVRREHYTTLAKHWLAIAELRLPLVSCGRALWTTPRLTVSIKPDFAVADAQGNVSVVKLWLKEPVLTPDAARAALRLLNRHMTDLCPNAAPLVVDVRREKIHRQSRRTLKRGYDDWLESEAEAMGGLWLRLAAA